MIRWSLVECSQNGIPRDFDEMILGSTSGHTCRSLRIRNKRNIWHVYYWSRWGSWRELCLLQPRLSKVGTYHRARYLLSWRRSLWDGGILWSNQDLWRTLHAILSRHLWDWKVTLGILPCTGNDHQFLCSIVWWNNPCLPWKGTLCYQIRDFMNTDSGNILYLDIS